MSTETIPLTEKPGAEVIALIADRLGETEEGPRKQIKRIVWALERTQALALLEKTLQIEEQGGMMLPNGSRRRTLGGVFFHLAYATGIPKPGKALRRPHTPTEKSKEAKQASSSKAAALVPTGLPFPWDDRIAAIEAIGNEKGRASTVKITFIGQLGKFVEKDSWWSLFPNNLKKGSFLMKEKHSYKNPVLPGFYPDPSICRVGGDYYLVTSSFEYFPGVPIFHSRDLLHWRQIGHCLTRASQIPLSSPGIFAPTLRYHEGRFYMVTTNVSHGGNFYVHTDDPAGSWSEPIFLQQGGIDPSLCFDEGHVYLRTQGEWPPMSTGLRRGIYQCEIDITTGVQLTETRYIWSGSGGCLPEGPHLYHIGEYYYLMIAEGGTRYGHMETLARSKSPWGPFEACPYNPLLTHRDEDVHPVQGTGHADLIEAHDGSWWVVFLAFRPHDEQYHHLGRETFLAPVTWTLDGWPLLSTGKTVRLIMEAETLPAHVWPQESAREDFNSPNLHFCWNFLRNPDPASWSLSERPGWLRLYGSALTLDAQESSTFVGRRQQHFVCYVHTHLHFAPARDGEEAGLTVLMNNQHHYEIALTRLEGQTQVIVRRRIGDLSALVARAELDTETIELEISADINAYTFSYVLPGQDPATLAKGSTRYLSSEVAGGYTGVYIGMYATSNGQGQTGPADFDWFEYLPLD